ncbi:MAG: DUF1648 domain-containing protein [Bacteroidota bacterium]
MDSPILRNIALASVIGGFILIVVHYGELPDRMPSHFDPQGNPDGYGHKGLLWLLAFINLGTYAMMSWVPNAPRDMMNYPVKITPENEERQYKNMVDMVLAMRLAIAVNFAYMIYGIIYTGLGRMNGLGSWSLWIFLGSVFLPIIYYCWRSYQLK